MPSGRSRSLEARDALQVAESPKAGMKILDLPELALELILAKLSPAELCNMACVCKSLCSRCRSDYLWESHMTGKWRRVLGEAARKKWELQVASMRRTRSLPPNSLIAFYLALESGRFSFPAQVFNRENGHAGFLLSCYDAEISYNARSNKFYVRYPPHGKRVPPIEEVPWQRIRAPSVDTFQQMISTSQIAWENYILVIILRYSGEETKSFPMVGGMELLAIWRCATEANIAAVVMQVF
ncbi:hypothetical protein HPP92_018979 [Vanilla planifolia]|uniref:F-box domain-containing protein n=1 Tax=Vanilla planifolia TaxID=51239 RepID=A0A835QD33_VANPL|nr:hypothetical protein HPP92_018979 [Vanilla planifolia]